MWSKQRMSQSKGALSVHPEATNTAGQMTVKVVFITFHCKTCNVYKAMNHVVLFRAVLYAKELSYQK